MLAVDPDNPNRLIAAGFIQSGGKTLMGIHLSTDGGNTWAQIKIRDDAGSQATVAVFDPSNSNTIYVAGYTAAWTPVLYRSKDGGSTWSQLTSPSSRVYLSSLAVDPSAPKILYAGGSWGGIAKSTDGGSTWTQLSGKAPWSVNCIAVNPSNASEVFVGNNTGVFYSNNGGSSWTDISADLAAKIVNRVVIDGPGRKVYAGTEGGGLCQRGF